MKNLSLAAIAALVLSAGFTTQSKAQTSTVSIENLATPVSVVKAETVITETPYYGKNGKVEYIVKRYRQNDLPEDVNNLVRKQFYNFDITGVEEVASALNNNSIYFVHVANDKKLITVKVFNGETEVLNVYDNGSTAK